LRVNPRSTTSCGGLSGCSHTPDSDGFPEGSRHSHIGSFALANKCPLHSKEHSSGRASHVFGNPSGSGLLKIPNGRRQEARRPGILAPDNPPQTSLPKKKTGVERGSARLGGTRPAGRRCRRSTGLVGKRTSLSLQDDLNDARTTSDPSGLHSLSDPGHPSTPTSRNQSL
jgi:hypothetical protein